MSLSQSFLVDHTPPFRSPSNSRSPSSFPPWYWQHVFLLSPPTILPSKLTIGHALPPPPPPLRQFVPLVPPNLREIAPILLQPNPLTLFSAGPPPFPPPPCMHDSLSSFSFHCARELLSVTNSNLPSPCPLVPFYLSSIHFLSPAGDMDAIPSPLPTLRFLGSFS